MAAKDASKEVSATADGAAQALGVGKAPSGAKRGRPAKPRPDFTGKPDVASKEATLTPPAATGVPEAKAVPVNPDVPKTAAADPASEKPTIKAKPTVKAPAVKAPAVKAPAVKAPAVKAPAVKAPLARAPAALKPALATGLVSAPKISAKPVVAKPTLKVASIDAPVPPAAVVETAKGAAVTTASKIEQTFAGLFTPFMLEDTKMDMSTNFSGFQDAVSEAQAKAKAAFEKGTSAFGEATEFAKGNVEAVIESGKIYAEGVQALGSELVAEGRSAFETITADIKELAAVKSPTDFFRIQGDLMRKNFDSAVAYGSKNSEAMLKLVSDAVAPISGRVSIAMEKARSTSL